MSELIIILCLFLVNGLFAMAEVALISSRKAHLMKLADEGRSGAKIAIQLLAKPQHFLSTVQIGITLVGIISGVYAGGAFSEKLLILISSVTWLVPYAEELSYGFIVLTITYFSVLIGELVPKSIALNDPERIAIRLAPLMKVLSKLAYPLVRILELSTKITLKALPLKENNKTPVTEDELKFMIDTGSKYGIIEKQEREILQSVFKFGDRKASEIMTARKKIKWLDIASEKNEVLSEIIKYPYTKYPVCDASLNKIAGSITVIDIIKFSKQTGFNLKDHLSPPLYFREDVKAIKILDEFRKRQIHIGFVINKQQETLGLITLHDLIENVMGEFPDFTTTPLAEITTREDGSLLADAEISMSELNMNLQLENLPVNYKTLGGFIVFMLPSVPRTGSAFIYGKYKFEIIDMDGNKIDKVLITEVKKII